MSKFVVNVVLTQLVCRQLHAPTATLNSLSHTSNWSITKPKAKHPIEKSSNHVCV